MTALNFAISDEGIFLATDTLVTRDGRPLTFTAKVLMLPHVHGLVSGTGSIVLFQRWSHEIHSETLATHMQLLNICTPGRLRKIWAEMSDVERDNGPSDIYHLYYDPDDDQFGGFAYRCSNDFESEPLDNGDYSKPDWGYATPIIDFPGDLIRACRRQRFAQEKLAPGERLQIGGQVIAYTMQRHEAEGQPMSTLTTAQIAYEFEDYEEMSIDCDEQIEVDDDVWGSDPETCRSAI